MTECQTVLRLEVRKMKEGQQQNQENIEPWLRIALGKSQHVKPCATHRLDAQCIYLFLIEG